MGRGTERGVLPGIDYPCFRRIRGNKPVRAFPQRFEQHGGLAVCSSSSLLCFFRFSCICQDDSKRGGMKKGRDCKGTGRTREEIKRAERRERGAGHTSTDNPGRRDSLLEEQSRRKNIDIPPSSLAAIN